MFRISQKEMHLVKISQNLAYILLFVLLLPSHLFSFDVWDLKRRKKQDGKELGYFFYPLVYTVPGVGSGNGAGGTIINLLGDGSTLNLIRIRGDYEVDAVAATGMPIFTPRLNLSLAYAHGRKGAFSFYGRGPDSSQTPEFTLKFKDSYGYGAELSLNFFQRQLEFYAGYAAAVPKIDLDASDLGANIEDLPSQSSSEQEQSIAIFYKNMLKYFDLQRLVVRRQGILIDRTDDRIDPRNGLRLQYEHWDTVGIGITDTVVDDYSLTAYFPSKSKSSVLVANLFHSGSRVINPLESSVKFDRAACLEGLQKSDKKYNWISDDTICNGIEKGVQDFQKTEAGNSNATSLGGTQRLRSYPIGRFHDSYSFFFGLESRFYFMESSTPFNWIIEKGVFQAFQLAFFYEMGQVSPKNDANLYKDLKSSSGVGLRIVFSSVVLRADIARGEEGSERTVFVGYGF